jgi:hypothetical protein
MSVMQLGFVYIRCAVTDLVAHTSSSSSNPGWKGSSIDRKVAPCFAKVDSIAAIPEERMFERALSGVDMAIYLLIWVGNNPA